LVEPSLHLFAGRRDNEIINKAQRLIVCEAPIRRNAIGATTSKAVRKFHGLLLDL
jgi:hypothetical protein